MLWHPVIQRNGALAKDVLREARHPPGENDDRAKIATYIFIIKS